MGKTSNILNINFNQVHGTKFCQLFSRHLARMLISLYCYTNTWLKQSLRNLNTLQQQTRFIIVTASYSAPLWSNQRDLLQALSFPWKVARLKITAVTIYSLWSSNITTGSRTPCRWYANSLLCFLLCDFRANLQYSLLKFLSRPQTWEQLHSTHAWINR